MVATFSTDLYEMSSLIVDKCILWHLLHIFSTDNDHEVSDNSGIATVQILSLLDTHTESHHRELVCTLNDNKHHIQARLTHEAIEHYIHTYITQS